MKEPVSQLTDDEEFLKQLSPDAVVAFLGRDDIAEKAGELQVSCAMKSERKNHIYNMLSGSQGRDGILARLCVIDP